MPQRFHHRCVRDLAWACFSEPLVLAPQLDGAGTRLSNAGFELTGVRREWLAALDARPAPLQAFLARAQARRLGLYFERLWQFFLQSDPEVELLAHNLPVRDGGRTIGEFDCLYFCRRRQRHCHLELAVKFYLGHEGASGAPSPRESRCDNPTNGHWHAWLGPNSRDRLDLKLRRLLDHQVRLADTPQGRRLLAEHGIHDPLRELELKGYLFRHPRAPLAAPPAFNPARGLRAWWRLADLPGALEPQYRYRVLPRLEWLAPARDRAGSDNTAENERTAGDPPLSARALAANLQARFNAHQQACLVAALDGAGEEIARFFVTDADWPEKPAGR